MPRRLLACLPVLALGIFGCQGDRELQQELLNYKNDTRYQLELLTRHDQFLREKMEATQKDLGQAEFSDRQLKRDFSSYSQRPDQIKREILEDAAQRKERILAQQEDFFREITGKLDADDTRLQEKLGETSDDIAERLDGEGRFFDYVMSAQDSVNMVFARRFDARPWYESVLGKWTERKSN